MNGLEVLQALEAGKKVRLSTWNPEHYIHGSNGVYVNHDGESPWLKTVKDFFSYTTWEIYTPPLTYIEALTKLEPGDKIRVISGGNGARGVDGKVGTIVTEKSYNGVSNTFFKFKTDNPGDWVWGLAKDCLVEKV